MRKEQNIINSGWLIYNLTEPRNLGPDSKYTHRADGFERSERPEETAHASMPRQPSNEESVLQVLADMAMHRTAQSRFQKSQASRARKSARIIRHNGRA